MELDEMLLCSDTIGTVSKAEGMFLWLL